MCLLVSVVIVSTAHVSKGSCLCCPTSSFLRAWRCRSGRFCPPVAECGHDARSMCGCSLQSTATHLPSVMYHHNSSLSSASSSFVHFFAHVRCHGWAWGCFGQGEWQCAQGGIMQSCLGGWKVVVCGGCCSHSTVEQRCWALVGIVLPLSSVASHYFVLLLFLLFFFFFFFLTLDFPLILFWFFCYLDHKVLVVSVLDAVPLPIIFCFHWRQPIFWQPVVQASTTQRLCLLWIRSLMTWPNDRCAWL